MPARSTSRRPSADRPSRSAVPAPTPSVPRFTVSNLDRSADPGTDFYRFAAGGWIAKNPVPADKSRWGGFGELAERNLAILHGILESTRTLGRSGATGPPASVGAMYASAMDTRRLEELGYRSLEETLRRIAGIRTTRQLLRVLAELHERTIDGLFSPFVSPDRKDSGTYAFYLMQGGLSLPDRNYYLTAEFAPQRAAFETHVTKSLTMLGDDPAEASGSATTILEIETELARAGRSRTELRDANRNYNPIRSKQFIARHAKVPWAEYFQVRDIDRVPSIVIGQPEFFDRLDTLVTERSIADWRTYLRWHVLTDSAPYLHDAAEQENFAFYHRVLLGQQEPEPRWKRAARVVDQTLGEALGQLYVEQHFPPEARARMRELVDDLRAVFRGRLQRLAWMSPATRRKALAKFDRFTAKIGHPDRYRDYSSIRIDPADYLGNVWRSANFEVRRQMVRIGQPVDLTEWHMTPPVVNAYFNATQNEIVFPAGILQPPFFDLAMDDAVNYGGIGAVIGHEITHGYDDQGRKFDADGNLNDWWSPKDAKEFDRRAKQIVDEYNAFEPLPGVHVNGELTMGENIADVGGVSIAYEALQRRLASDPSRRKVIDGFTPEQRFFLSFAQIWRENATEPDLRRRITVDPHSPGRFRAIGAVSNLPEFYSAFGVAPQAPMWRPKDRRVVIW
jgi:putative endopeptidase